MFPKANSLTETIIGGAVEVHKSLGPGLTEPAYEWCLLREFELRGLPTVDQKIVRISYKGFVREEPLRFDVLVDGCVLIECKAVQAVLPIHVAQMLSYMKILDVPVGLLINFNVGRLVDGVHRAILPRSNL